MNRYLGTKTKILADIERAIASLGQVSDVCDIFAGSLSVSLFLKRAGYAVIANDINALSYAYARAYLTCATVPQFDVAKLVPSLRGQAGGRVESYAGRLVAAQEELFASENKYSEFRSWEDYADQMRSLARVLAFLQRGNEPSHRELGLRSDIVDHYTKGGRYSAYESVRGQRGKRNFFSLVNARRLDFVLSHIRYWRQSGLLEEQAKYTLLSILLDGMERCVNSQGTYHDFPRHRLEQRARKQLRLTLPNYFGLLYSGKKHMAASEDSLAFAVRAPAHDVLYVDPPYNFRQYTAYYHLPNFFVRYPEIADLDAYLGELAFVRGQNMRDDFSSPFSNRDRFLPALKRLVGTAKSRYVVLSYFDGVNHWNRFLTADNSRGYELLREFFESSVFRPGSLKVIPVERVNYQSQNGHRAKKVTEYLFVAERHERPRDTVGRGA